MRHESNEGFTVLELLIVTAMISILAAILIPNVINARRLAVNTASSMYARNVSYWAGAWLISDPARRVTDLSTDCVDAMYISEGAPNDFPTSTQSCEVLIEPNGPGSFGVRATSASGQVFEIFY
jgi:type IV pilus assembly protein PilA